MLKWGEYFQGLSWVMGIGFILILLLVGALLYRKRDVPRYLVQATGLLEFLRKNTTLNLYKIFYIFNKGLFVLGIVFLLVALARPQTRDESTTETSEGINIMMVLDISDSMLIEDMQPENRLEAAKLRIKEFVEKRVSDRIGLVVFSGQSYTRVPLTLDYPLLLESLEMVKTSERIRKGTAIGVALANAVTRLQKAQGESNVIILLTDGENNIGAIDPITSMEIAKKENIRVYTVGIGKDGMANLPIYRKFPNGMVQKYYRPMHSSVNDALLGQIAKETGGKYYRAEDSQNLNAVFSDIDQLEKTEIETHTSTLVTELYAGWNFWGLILIFISQAMNLLWFWRIY